MKVQEIAKQTTLGDEQVLKKALNDWKSTSDSDLHFYLVLRDTLNATAADTRKAITLAQVEWERRKKRNRVSRLPHHRAVWLHRHLRRHSRSAFDTVANIVAF